MSAPPVTPLPLPRTVLRPVPEEGVIVTGSVGLRASGGPVPGEPFACFAIDGKVARRAPPAST